MIKKYQLKNGLNIILNESHKSPVVSVQMWVRTGSADEQKGEEGISHFIEHLVFKGTQKYKVGEIASIVEGSGGELNAYTSFDQTVFYVTISKQYTDVALSTVSEMMGFPTFDKVEIDNEREVVIEEIKRGQDSLSRKASELLFKTSYKKHPYGIPVIGYDKNIRKLTSQQIKRYFQSRYVPKNMFLVVSGDFESNEMKKKVESFFGSFKDYKLKKIIRKKDPVQRKACIAVEKTNFEQSMAYLSWKIPNIKHKDIPALDILGMILGNGDTSRLVRKMRIEKVSVNAVGASTYTPMDEGLFIISMNYSKEKLQEALDDISEALVALFKNLPEEEEIKKAVLHLATEDFYSVETVDGLSRKLGSLEFYFKDLKAQDKFLKKAQLVTVKDVLSVAKKYLTSKNINISITTNDDAIKTKKITQDWLKKISSIEKNMSKTILKNKKIKHQKIGKSSLKASDPKTEKITLSNGVTMILRPHTDTHLISAKAVYLGGIRSEKQNIDGLTELLGRTWTCGTLTKSELDIYKEIESITASLSPVSGRNSMGLGLDVLQIFQKKGLDIFFDVLTKPLFSSESIAREKIVQNQQIKSKNDNPAQVCMKLFLQGIFAGHPYSRDLLGQNDSLEKINHEVLLNYWKQTAQRKNLTLAITGNFDSQLWKDAAEKHLSYLSEGKRFNEKFSISNIENDIYKFEPSKKEQSHVMMGFRGLTLTDEDRYTLQVIQSILAGQGGRLFIELRDKNSLAYSVSPMKMEGIETGYFGAYIGCSPEKVKTALQMMKQEFNRLIEEKVPAAEIERAKKYIIGRHDIDLQRTNSICSSILYNDIYGIDYDEVFNYSHFYDNIDTGKIQKLAERLFSQKTVISVVGPNNPF